MLLTLRNLSQKSAWWLYDAAAGGGSTIAAERLVYLGSTTDNEYCEERSMGPVEYCTDNGYCNEIAKGWVASGGFAQANVRAYACVEV